MQNATWLEGETGERCRGQVLIAWASLQARFKAFEAVTSITDKPVKFHMQR